MLCIKIGRVTLPIHYLVLSSVNTAKIMLVYVIDYNAMLFDIIILQALSVICVMFLLFL